MTWLGSGKAPVISTTGTSLHVFAYDPQSSHESLIRTWVATDGINWNAGTPLGGRPFKYVLDHNQSWAFADQPQHGDMLFSLSDATGWIGNRIGSSRILHRLDSSNKKLDFGFTSSTSGTTNQVKIWATSSGAPYYKLGIQGDSQGNPSGDWLSGSLNGIEVDSFAEFTISDSVSSQLVTLDLPETLLEASTPYHLVAEPSCTQVTPGKCYALAGPNNWVEIEGVGADPAANFPFGVRTKAGSSPWVTASGEVPRIVLSGPSGLLLSQEIIPRPYTYGAMEYVVTGESFVPSQNITPSQIRLHLVKTGNPSAATIRLLDSTNTELWSATANPASSGWVSLAITGVSLSSGSRYRLVVDHDSRDTNNYWAFQPSGVGALSWEGTGSALTSSHSRIGFSDRSVEASDQLTNPWFRDFVAFDSSATDELYLGDDEPFDFAAMVRLASDGGGAVATAFSYWNGLAWIPIAMTRNDFLAGGFAGEAEFPPPTDWSKRTLEGKTAYWVQVTTTTGAPSPILIERTTGIGDLRNPASASRGRGFVPLAHQRLNSQAAIDFAAHDALPPTLGRSSFSPAPGGNAAFASLPLLVNALDLGSGLKAERIVFVLEDLTAGTSTSRQAVSYDADTKWAKTPNVDLQVGHRYGMSVSLTDEAGNQSLWDMGDEEFLAMSFGLEQSATDASVPDSPCEVGSEIGGDGLREVVCREAAVYLAPTQVTLSATKHVGVGRLLQAVSMDQLRIIPQANGEPLPAVRPSLADEARTEEMHFLVREASSVSTIYPVRPAQWSLGEIRARVPASTTQASVQMQETQTVVSSAACPDPSLSGLPGWPCSPDPVWGMGGVRFEPPLLPEELSQAPEIAGSLQFDYQVSLNPEATLPWTVGLTSSVPPAQATQEVADRVHSIVSELAEGLEATEDPHAKAPYLRSLAQIPLPYLVKGIAIEGENPAEVTDLYFDLADRYGARFIPIACIIDSLIPWNEDPNSAEAGSGCGPGGGDPGDPGGSPPSPDQYQPSEGRWWCDYEDTINSPFPGTPPYHHYQMWFNPMWTSDSQLSEYKNDGDAALEFSLVYQKALEDCDVNYPDCPEAGKNIAKRENATDFPDANWQGATVDDKYTQFEFGTNNADQIQAGVLYTNWWRIVVIGARYDQLRQQNQPQFNLFISVDKDMSCQPCGDWGFVSDDAYDAPLTNTDYLCHGAGSGQGETWDNINY